MQGNENGDSYISPPFQVDPSFQKSAGQLEQHHPSASLEEMQYWQQGIPQQQITPEMIQQWQQQSYQLQMQQMQQLQQMQGMSPEMLKKARKAPKQSRRGGRLWRMFFLVVGLFIVGVSGWMLIQSQRGSAPTTAIIEVGVLGTSYRGDAMIVRNESAFEDEGVQSIEYVAEEGSQVKRGSVVCYVYSTGYSSREMATLQDYRDQIKDFQSSLLRSDANTDTKMSTLESDVIEKGLQVRSLVQGARGNLINQEKILLSSITQRQDYFRSKYSDNMSLNRLFDDEATQQQRINSWIKQRAASQDSIISFYTDGYEHALTLDNFESYTPAEVRAMISGQRPEISAAARGRTTIYRLVNPSRYGVLMLIENTTWNPVEGSTVKLMLEQFSNTIVEAGILSFTRSGSDLLLRLGVLGDVSSVLYMRTCQAELGEYVDCLAVPSRALYEQGGAKGVVIIDGEQQLFVPVQIVAEEGGMTYVSAVQTGILSPGQTVRLF